MQKNVIFVENESKKMLKIQIIESDTQISGIIYIIQGNREAQHIVFKI